MMVVHNNSVLGFIVQFRPEILGGINMKLLKGLRR